MIKELIQLRKELHQNPELSGLEVETAKKVKSFIANYHPTAIIDNIGGNGFVAVYEFASTGPTIAIRCELDALPILEENSFSHKSKKINVSHKCGHDGHMAIVSGLLFWIKEQQFISGKIVLLFQPAEETGKGAYQVIQDDRFKALNVDYVFALHNIPGEPLHSIITTNKGFSAEVQSFKIRIKGKESHASEPEKGINPSVGLAEMILALEQLNSNNPLDEDFMVLTPVHLKMGQKSYGISPSNGEIHYTIRTWSTEKMDALQSRIQVIISQLCKQHNLKYETNWFEYFPASKNNKNCIDYIIQAANQNKYTIINRAYPFKFGEDFGWFSKEYKTGMFGLGAGINTPPLHSTDYDFPDELIETGINMFKEIITQILLEKK